MSLNRTLEEEQSQLQAPGEVYADMMYVEGQNANELITPSVSAEPIDRFNFVYWYLLISLFTILSYIFLFSL